MRILVSPLDWGLGHATRLIPIIRSLLAKGDEVVVAGSGSSLQLLRSEFPLLECVPLRSFSPKFSSNLPQWIMISLQVPKFLICMYVEHYRTEQIVRKMHIDEIISDNRYGVCSSLCKSSIITHQLSPLPWRGSSYIVNSIISRIVGRWISRFDECLIPDYASDGNGLSGRLSVSQYVKCKTTCIGLQSRLVDDDHNRHENIDVLALISGPEPQRSILEQLVLTVAKHSRREFLVVNGTITAIDKVCDNVRIVGSPSAAELKAYIKSAKTIICRSGYSTLMDLMLMGRRAILVPTPGQAEQEYLAERCKDIGFDSVEQRNFILFCEKKNRDL
ncbi:MAG: hypothetical protein J6Y72_04050 [Bacteroidales bacterium]|nr:hypothetical protein [Bacteroidales bacterium]